ncbi:hypothetical protein VP01_434g4 [Puccinia sorghi]|uniref:RRM domain-containing protein n=1 Tax=Puccinia sorghi TaxID=27349 RepID=A0A0L6URV0_9BASI|nr:hypothetical protein VP01_434g4 [Puccinia sorghi]
MFPERNLVGANNGIGLAHKVLLSDSERWGNDPRRRGDDITQPLSHSRNHRSETFQATAQDVQPLVPAHLEECTVPIQEVAHLAVPLALPLATVMIEVCTSRPFISTLVPTLLNVDDPNPKYAHSNGRPSGYGPRGRDHLDDSGRRATGREMAALEASKRSIKENRVYVGNLAFSVKWNDLKVSSIINFSRSPRKIVLRNADICQTGRRIICVRPSCTAYFICHQKGCWDYGLPLLDSFMKIGLRRALGFTWRSRIPLHLGGWAHLFRYDFVTQAGLSSSNVDELMTWKGGGLMVALASMMQKLGDWLLTGGMDLVVSRLNHGGNWHFSLTYIYSGQRGLCGGDGPSQWNDKHTIPIADISLKGCGVVEFSTREEAERAVRELNDTPLLGRQIFVREDREEEARYGSLAVSGNGGRGPLPGGFGGRGSVGRGFTGGRNSFSESGQSCKQLTVSGLPLTVGWQDLKDMFRSAGNIIRADIFFGADGSPTGTGTVIFETSRDAQNAICWSSLILLIRIAFTPILTMIFFPVSPSAMFNGFEYEGRTMEVREDRAGSANAGFRGGHHGSTRGSLGSVLQPTTDNFGGSGPGGRDTSNLYGDYSGQDGSPSSPPGYRGAPRGITEGPSLSIQPNQQIFVKNLPWSTSNDDLVELFQTTGRVQHAEVLFDGGRSKGVGVGATRPERCTFHLIFFLITTSQIPKLLLWWSTIIPRVQRPVARLLTGPIGYATFFFCLPTLSFPRLNFIGRAVITT